MNYLLESGIFGLLALFFGFIIAIAGSFMILLSNSKRVRLLAVIFSIIPLLLGITGTIQGYRTNARYLPPSQLTSEAKDYWHSELASPSIIGGSTTLLLSILLGTLFVSRMNRPSQQDLPADSSFIE